MQARAVKYVVAAVIAFVLPVAAEAETTGRGTKPLWEAGIAGTAVYGAHYPAADESSLRGLGLPYVIYRGDVFRLGDGSLASGVFVDDDDLKFDVSLGRLFNLNSEDNTARRGMPDLDFLFEVGPQLTLKLGEHYGGRISLALPLRTVHSTDLKSVSFRGLKFAPKLTYKTFVRVLRTRTGLSLSVGATFADEKLHDLFYEVEPRFALPGRRAFDADAGYLGSDLNVGMSFTLTDRLVLFTGGRASYYGGAANAASPLFRDPWNLSITSGLVWSLYRSETRAASGR